MKIRTLTLDLLLIAIGLTLLAIADFLWIPISMAWLTAVTTLVTFSFAVLHGGQRYGWASLAILLAATVVISLAFESFGVATGRVYGPYHYTQKLGPKFLGLVPYIIPAAWFMMMYASQVMAERVLHQRTTSNLGRILTVAAVGAVIMTAWDLAMDPLMVAGEHWVWEVQGAYFGIPLQNYAGWWLTSFCVLVAFQLARWGLHARPVAPSVPDRWAVIAYALMGGSTILMDFLTGLDGPALVGIFALLPWILLAWRVEPEYSA